MPDLRLGAAGLMTQSRVQSCDSLADVVDAIGWEKAVLLVRRFGGERVTLWSAERNPELVDVIGQDAAETLCARFAGDRIALPSTLRREIVVREMWARTPRPTINEIVEVTFLSYRQIHRILARDPKDVTLASGEMVRLPLFDGL
jgi:pimeloyl-ACP methyl ester carboxylesterase